MDFLTWGRSPWDQPILTHVSWDLLWASLFAGVAFLVAHAGYMVLSAHRKRHAAETDAMEAARAHLPERIVRHSMAARLFHWRGLEDDDGARLARVIARRSIGLVLSGGGSRAYAHIGVIRALREAGLPFDVIGGTSMGAGR